MKNLVNSGLIKFYLLVGMIVFAMGTLGTSLLYPGHLVAVIFNGFWVIIYSIVLNYFFFEHIIPFVWRKRQAIIRNVLWGILLLFIYLMFCSYGLFVWRWLGMQIGIYHLLNIPETVNHGLQNMMSYSAMAFFVFLIAKHLYTYIKLKQAAQQLRIEKQEAELNYLKSQTNPHFLFNTLNNIYSLTRDKSDLAPESVMRLSKILRFMLYETGGNFISIEQEIKIIADYIELEKLRYDESLRVNFNYDIEDMKQALPPLLLMPLVENAFKHGVSETRLNPFVDIHLSINNSQLELKIKNSTEKSSNEKRVKESIGLSNLRRQLQLLYTDYNLFLKPGDSDFTAVLKINLASYV